MFKVNVHLRGVVQTKLTLELQLAAFQILQAERAP